MSKYSKIEIKNGYKICLICNIPQSKLKRHLILKHKQNFNDHVNLKQYEKAKYFSKKQKFSYCPIENCSKGTRNLKKHLINFHKKKPEEIKDTDKLIHKSDKRSKINKTHKHFIINYIEEYDISNQKKFLYDCDKKLQEIQLNLLALTSPLLIKKSYNHILNYWKTIYKKGTIIVNYHKLKKFIDWIWGVKLKENKPQYIFNIENDIKRDINNNIKNDCKRIDVKLIETRGMELIEDEKYIQLESAINSELHDAIKNYGTDIINGFFMWKMYPSGVRTSTLQNLLSDAVTKNATFLKKYDIYLIEVYKHKTSNIYGSHKIMLKTVSKKTTADIQQTSLIDNTAHTFKDYPCDKWSPLPSGVTRL